MTSGPRIAGALVCALQATVWLASSPASGAGDEPAAKEPFAAVDASAPSDSTGFDYLYIVANEGGSSGGHVAIRFGREVYDFQARDGLLTLRRQDAEAFLFQYALLENRAVHSARVAVDEATFFALRDRFRRRHRAQEGQLEVARSLRRDRRLAELLREPRDPGESEAAALLAVRGLGYFERESASPAAGERNAAIVALRREILRSYGPDVLAQRRRAVVEQLQALLAEPPAVEAAHPPRSVYDLPPFARSASERWLDLRAGLAALDVLEQARPLAEAAHHAPGDVAFELSPDEVAALRRFAATLESQLRELVVSRRPDWGQTLLIGMARAAALERSIDSGRLVFLDAFPDDAESVSIDGRRELAAAMLAENRRELAAARGFLRSDRRIDELAWERLEERANRTFEMMRALDTGAPLRLASGHLVPSRSGRLPRVAGVEDLRAPPGAGDPDRLEVARERERRYGAALAAVHGYRLVTRNCATAIFETLNDAFDGSVDRSRRALGGFIAGSRSLAFVPFVSAGEVNDRYRVVRRETVRSYRSLRLAEMKASESPLRVSLRESNTLTARSYRRGAGDSFFVFFTERPVWIRPILGAINLAAAVGETTLGIVLAPVDRGATLVRGLRGAFVSLPELLFANIRKGTNEWIPPEQRNLDPVGSKKVGSARRSEPGDVISFDTDDGRQSGSGI